jgi:hypothetical protein
MAKLPRKSPDTNSGPPEALRRLLTEDRSTPSADRLQRLRDAVSGARAMESEKADLEARLKETNIALYNLYMKDLPDLFDEVGVDSISLPPEGNYPGVIATASPYYRANISAEWDHTKRTEGFAYLEGMDAKDLIKTIVTVPFNREDRARAQELVMKLQAMGYLPIVAESVHNMTLTAWLKEQVEVKHKLPDLDKIGGTVGRIVKLKDQK